MHNKFSIPTNVEVRYHIINDFSHFKRRKAENSLADTLIKERPQQQQQLQHKSLNIPQSGNHSLHCNLYSVFVNIYKRHPSAFGTLFCEMWLLAFFFIIFFFILSFSISLFWRTFVFRFHRPAALAEFFCIPRLHVATAHMFKCEMQYFLLYTVELFSRILVLQF